jgi:hypothetical protein
MCLLVALLLLWVAMPGWSRFQGYMEDVWLQKVEGTSPEDES